MQKLIVVLMLVFTLTACEISMSGISPEIAYDCPVPWDVAKEAEPLITAVNYDTWKSFQTRSFAKHYAEFNPEDFSIRMYEGLSARSEREHYEHEVCHAYMRAFANSPDDVEQNHLHPWKVANFPF